MSENWILNQINQCARSISLHNPFKISHNVINWNRFVKSAFKLNIEHLTKNRVVNAIKCFGWNLKLNQNQLKMRVKNAVLWKTPCYRFSILCNVKFPKWIAALHSLNLFFKLSDFPIIVQMHKCWIPNTTVEWWMENVCYENVYFSHIRLRNSTTSKPLNAELQMIFKYISKHEQCLKQNCALCMRNNKTDEKRRKISRAKRSTNILAMIRLANKRRARSQMINSVTVPKKKQGKKRYEKREKLVEEKMAEWVSLVRFNSIRFNANDDRPTKFNQEVL